MKSDCACVAFAKFYVKLICTSSSGEKLRLNVNLSLLQFCRNISKFILKCVNVQKVAFLRLDLFRKSIKVSRVLKYDFAWNFAGKRDQNLNAHIQK